MLEPAVRRYERASVQMDSTARPGRHSVLLEEAAGEGRVAAARVDGSAAAVRAPEITPSLWPVQGRPMLLG